MLCTLAKSNPNQIPNKPNPSSLFFLHDSSSDTVSNVPLVELFVLLLNSRRRIFAPTISLDPIRDLLPLLRLEALLNLLLGLEQTRYLLDLSVMPT